MINNKSKVKWLVLLLIVSSVLFGAFQEKMKIHINSNIELAQRVQGYDLLSALDRKDRIEDVRSDIKYSYYSSHKKMDILYTLDSTDLNRLKWLLVPVFLLVNFLLNLGLIFALNLDWRRLLWLYVIAIVVVSVVFGVGKVFGVSFFPFVRRGVLFMETVIPVVVLYFSQIIFDQKK